ncbi:MAG TPA: hypothetical protein VKE23_05455 [Candidatus Limnocylindria bacterium]|nr:hypothetical protein [Candidatus Limnocylindria bacterium]
MGILKLLAVLIAVLWMAAVESVQPSRSKDEEDIVLFVGSAHPLASTGHRRADSTRRPLA